VSDGAYLPTNMEVTLTPEDIRQRRIEADLSMADVASALDLNTRTIERWETGAARPSKADLIALEAVFSEQVGAKPTSRTARKAQKR